MEAAFLYTNFNSGLSLKEATKAFFDSNTPESTKGHFWKFFQCWVTRDCNLKSDLSDEEVALFFDQLIDLVAAAYILHQANRVLPTEQEGDKHV
jgi:hypothetical protein